MDKKCLVKGCPNHTDAGIFIGDLCAPCHQMITTGKIPFYGNTFIHKLNSRIMDIHKALNAKETEE